MCTPVCIFLNPEPSTGTLLTFSKYGRLNQTFRANVSYLYHQQRVYTFAEQSTTHHRNDDEQKLVIITSEPNPWVQTITHVIMS